MKRIEVLSVPIYFLNPKEVAIIERDKEFIEEFHLRTRKKSDGSRIYTHLALIPGSIGFLDAIIALLSLENNDVFEL